MSEAKKNESIQPEKLDLNSLDVVEYQKAKLRELFPEIVTEGGKVDFHKLQVLLGDHVDDSKEKFGLYWAGKTDCYKTIQKPSNAALSPLIEQSLEFDLAKNIVIEGDNLEVLKLLQKSYLGKIKLIYIDPPYNTGNEFIYPDNFSESLETYLQYSGQSDPEGRKFSTNAETDGRFHSKWLSMIYPRLFLARNLLTESGVIMVSIDDHEVTSLRKVLDEIFGEENFLGCIIWKGATDNNPTQIATEHEYILCYGRSREAISEPWKNSEEDAKNVLLNEFSKIEKSSQNLEEIQRRIRTFIKSNKEALTAVTHYDRVDKRGLYTGSRKVHNPKPGGYQYDVVHPANKKVCSPPVNGYRYPKDRMDQLISEDKILFGDDETQIVQIKEYLQDYAGKLSSVINLDSRTGSNELESIFEIQKLFPNPKPVALLKSLFDFVLKPDDTVLDFFAGSGSSGQAVLDLNFKDKGQRKFILVQLPESTRIQKGESEQETPASKAGYVTIAQICRERIKRIIEKNAESAVKQQLPLLSRDDKLNREGFRAFRLVPSNFIPWNASVSAGTVQEQLKLSVRNVHSSTARQDLLWEILLKSGFPLDVSVEKMSLVDKEIFVVAGGVLVICLDQTISKELIQGIASTNPVRVVCLDSGFAGNDQLKVNAVETFKAKGITFKTV